MEETRAYISHVAQVCDTAQVTRQVSLLRLIVTGYEKRAHFAHDDDFPFVVLRYSAFNVLPVAVCFASLASIVSELRSIELSLTEFRNFKIHAVKHSLPVKVSTFRIPTVLHMTYFKMAGDRSRQYSFLRDNVMFSVYTCSAKFS